jgi:hypothetical protein
MRGIVPADAPLEAEARESGEPDPLVAAKGRAGTSSGSEPIETAVASLAVDDDFGRWLLGQRGRLPKDFEPELRV